MERKPITPVWDYSELLEEAKERIEEKLIIEGEIKPCPKKT